MAQKNTDKSHSSSQRKKIICTIDIKIEIGCMFIIFIY